MGDTLKASDTRVVPASMWRRLGRSLRLCAAIARPHHWTKNILVLVGVALALIHGSDLSKAQLVSQLLLALAATCLITSSYYVLNEALDAGSDRSHPRKKHRPVASGCVAPGLALLESLMIAVAGMGLSVTVNEPFVATAGVLLLVSLLYNVPPIRLKDIPYLDVISESINSPLRILLGWTAIEPGQFPPLPLLLFFWTAGAMLMSWKRLRELCEFRDTNGAAAYRKSFSHYNPQRLRRAMTCYFVAAFVCAAIQTAAWNKGDQNSPTTSLPALLNKAEKVVGLVASEPRILVPHVVQIQLVQIGEQIEDPAVMCPRLPEVSARWETTMSFRNAQHRDIQVAEIVHALRSLGGLPGPSQRRKREREQQRDDPDGDQQLEDRESRPMPRRGDRRPVVKGCLTLRI